MDLVVFKDMGNVKMFIAVRGEAVGLVGKLPFGCYHGSRFCYVDQSIINQVEISFLLIDVFHNTGGVVGIFRCIFIGGDN